MKISKISKKLPCEVESKVELQGCYDDCAEYKQKTASIYKMLRAAGYKADGSETTPQIREIISVFSYYCYKLKTPKTWIYW